MESTKNRKKGLLSIVSLIVCLAMLTVGTYAWFTDTATVKGNTIMAGKLDVAIVMKGKKIIDKVIPTADQAGTFEDDWATATAEGTPFASLKDATPVVKDTTEEADPDGNGYEAYYDVTNLEANVVDLGNLEPGQIYPVEMDVFNRGELAIGFTAGFNLPKRANADKKTNGNEYTSYTGLETLEKQKAGLPVWSVKPGSLGVDGVGAEINKAVLEGAALTEYYNHMKDKLVPKQWIKTDPETAYTAANAGNSSYDKGGYLENVLEVYAVSMTEYKEYYLDTDPDAPYWSADTADYFTKAEITDIYKTHIGADGNPEYDLDADGNKIKIGENKIMNEHFIGTIADIVHCNDDVYLDKLDENITTAEAPVKDADGNIIADHHQDYEKLTAEKERLASTRQKLAVSSSGYCLPKNIGSDKVDVTLKLANGKVKEYTAENGNAVSNIGTAVYLIKMSEDADDLYQNAYIKLDMGVTANQVKWDKDGTGYYLYDPTPETSEFTTP